MSETSYQWPGLGKILPDALAFALGLAVAWKLGWKTTDLVWSLWLGSLVLGYLSILSFIAAGAYLGAKLIAHPDFPPEKRLPVVLIGLITAVFLLGFFSFHFCAFHTVHASILSGFFPLAGLPRNAFSGTFMNPPLLWKEAFHYVLPVYGAFLVPAIIAERGALFAPLVWARRAVRGGFAGELAGGDVAQAGMAWKNTPHSPFKDPYINVIRMHLLIFFFAFCHFLKVESFIVFGVVYLVYFFPWKAFRKEAAPTQSDARQMSF
jgi:hypothetical protein